MIERAADGQQQSVQGYVIRNFRMSHGAQQDGIRRTQQIQGIRGHHAAVTEIMV